MALEAGSLVVPQRVRPAGTTTQMGFVLEHRILGEEARRRGLHRRRSARPLRRALVHRSADNHEPNHLTIRHRRFRGSSHCSRLLSSQRLLLRGVPQQARTVRRDTAADKQSSRRTR